MSGSHVDVPFTEPSSAHLTCPNGGLSAAGEDNHSVSESDKVPDKAHAVAKQTSNLPPALTPQSPVARGEPVGSGSNLDSSHGSRGQLPEVEALPGGSTALSQPSLSSQGNNLTRGLFSHKLSSEQEHDVASSSGTQRSPQLARSHKRTATGEIKPPNTSVAPPSPGTISAERHPAESIGWRSRGSKIAATQLSVHLRTRLSYAAAKIEKSRQSLDAQGKLPLDLLQESSSTPLVIVKSPPYADGSRRRDNDSPSGSPVSAPDMPIQSSLFPPNTRLSPAARSDDLSSVFPSKNSPGSPFSSKRMSATPRLAPPADIVPSGSSSSRRRRPNPNQALEASRYISSFDDRQHRSQHGTTDGSQKILVPGTPPLQSLSQPTSTPYNGLSRQSTHSQNASMEQDAIETLLFMSSPGNSAYHPSSQRQQSTSHISQTSLSTESSTSGSQLQDSQAAGGDHRRAGQARYLEAQAGDEIDRMLDQMEDSDSDNERKPIYR
ncbi:hypothetical protein IFM58399_01900 [Aspergillus lentulus]|uniref:Autophagy-related protein 13 n=1 Tax=Aspergillus lentulus TaxID=293939 RepID=A0ABQ0ZX44_ASPLE|nr:uncharacterized protein IFM58399_01900 [Aspergillus lentulus]GFF28168.1 hypothetical protein IFM58399_01900 [Aspergillus lentulus]GFF66716.1 hypothetical protein IFM47457_01472 [Aspergillus lentulus]GFF67828.1 hypothetical protein IFM60648_02398 [Aspergillus lentulus]GFG05711.1 hypothetical protein IFM61392_03976 [Aspergillus lentulus]